MNAARDIRFQRRRRDTELRARLDLGARQVQALEARLSCARSVDERFAHLYGDSDKFYLFYPFGQSDVKVLEHATPREARSACKGRISAA